ncbi:MAG TPA: TonB-dependent receptor [Vicinamibacterales bacterium]|nr:TonB-dependent receptor [Vicinamibacterales bacterium]
MPDLWVPGARRASRLSGRQIVWSFGVFLAASTVCLRTATAQVLTGALVGTVQDQQGSAIPGALVRMTSPALISGSQTVFTSDKGQFRFPVLQPGTYAIAIEVKGFAPYHEAGIIIGAGTTLQRTAVLQVAGVADSVVVEGSGSRIEARSSGVETRIGPEYLETVPTRRYSMFDAIRAAPGVSPTSPSSGTVNTVSAYGSGANENLFLIDGTNFTCPCAGVSRAEPSVDVIQEMQVQSVGVSAEYGNIQGTVFNVLTKQGSDRFQYDASYYGQPSSLTSQPKVLPVPGSSLSTGYERKRYRDFTTDLGGPVVRERLWFFTGYQYLRDSDSQPGTDPALPRAYQQDKLFGKLTWKLKPGLQLMQSVHHESWVNPDRPTVITPFEATTRPHATVRAITFGDLTHTWSSNTVWSARVGRFVYHLANPPSTGDFDTSGHVDRLTNVASEAPSVFGGLTLVRTTVKATLSHYRAGLMGADHDLKIGTQFEKGEHDQPSIITNGVMYIDDAGQPYRTVSAPPSTSGGLFLTGALFATDALTIGNRTTVNAGVRFDHSRAISQDIHAIDARGNKTSDMIEGRGTLYTWNVLSPRLGVTARLSSDGRTILRASYGRFNQGVLTGEISPVHPAVAPITTRQFDPTTGDYTTLVSVVDPAINLRIDPSTVTPHTDEFSVGVDRELNRRLASAIAYVHKSGTDFIAWTDTGGQYQQVTQVLPDGSTLPVFALTSPPASRRFLLTNPDGYSMTYNGLVMVLEKRRSSGWQALGSYTYSRVYGLQVSSGSTAAAPQVSTVAPAFPTAAFGRDPNDLTNAYGRLPNDRPHMFRLMGTVDVPRTGVMVSGNLQYFSGKPWAATALVRLPQGDQRILLEPLGSRRLSSQTLLDLRVSKIVSIGGANRIEAMFDVLNALNDTAEEALANDNRYNPLFGKPTVFVDPRRVMLGVRLNLGR